MWNCIGPILATFAHYQMNDITNHSFCCWKKQQTTNLSLGLKLNINLMYWPSKTEWAYKQSVYFIKEAGSWWHPSGKSQGHKTYLQVQMVKQTKTWLFNCGITSIFVAMLIASSFCIIYESHKTHRFCRFH